MVVFGHATIELVDNSAIKRACANPRVFNAALDGDACNAFALRTCRRTEYPVAPTVSPLPCTLWAFSLSKNRRARVCQRHCSTL